jgi:hypothetical protein
MFCYPSADALFAQSIKLAVINGWRASRRAVHVPFVAAVYCPCHRPVFVIEIVAPVVGMWRSQPTAMSWPTQSG